MKPTRLEDLPDLMKPEVAFAFLGLGRSTGYSLLKDGAIPAIHLGKRRIMVPRKGLERMIETASHVGKET